MSAHAVSVDKEPSVESLRVLVVDDNSSLLRFLVSAFSANGCDVAQAAAAEQALGIIETESFDLVVSDIKMPGLTGLDLLRAVKGAQPSTPVVLITGAPSVTSAVFGLRHGAYDYLAKPFSIKEIQDLLARVRDDRKKWNGRTPLPAGLTEELSRRQAGVETLLHLGRLALQGLEPAAFVDKVLEHTVRSLRSDAALLLLRDEEGHFTSSRHGEPALVNFVLAALQQTFEQVVKTGGRTVVTITQTGQPVDAIATAIPGVGRSMGLLCLARETKSGGFLPDEREMLLGYAQTTAVALQKLILRDNLERNLVDTITAFVNAIESKDPYLKGHSARVALYAAELATTMELTTEMVDVVRRGAMLHDLGKLSIMDTILRKPGALTEEEFALIKAHPVAGAKILEPLRFLTREVCAVRYHHERFNGTGYPDGLAGEDIPLVARITTVADVFDAITSNRPYRTAMSVEEAREEIARGRNSHFDPRIADAFARIPVERLVEFNRHYETLVSPAMPMDLAAAAALVSAQ
ncbi:MAG: HD domain-containing phosphohydrolase [Candidatus Rokuibacteriota bacterium]